MATTLVEPPFQAFLDSAGKALENGQIYIGQPGFEAQSTPKAAFFDTALSISAPQPIRTTAGYPVRNGSPTRFFVDGDYSITVLDRNGVRLFSSLTQQIVTQGLFPDGSLASAGIGFANEPNSGFIRASAGVVQQTILGAAVAEASATQYKLNVSLTKTTQPALTAGTNAQGQGPFTADIVLITTATANPSGATLPVGIIGEQVEVTNTGANPVNVYPAIGGQINALGVNNPILLPVGGTMTFLAFSATAWRAIPSVPTLVAGQFLRTNGAGTALEFAGDDFEPFSTSALTGLNTIDITGLGIFRDVLVVFVDVTSAAASKFFRVGNSGGMLLTNIYQSAGNALASAFTMTDSTALTRSGSLLIRNFNTSVARKACQGSCLLLTDTPVAVVEATALDRIRFLLTGAITATTGTLEVYGRR